MIKEIPPPQIDILIDFLKRVAPDQLPFVEGPYFKHGENISFGWFIGDRLVGGIRYCIQEIGLEQGTPRVEVDGKFLTEAKIHVFAVAPTFRNQSIGRKLQLHVIEDARRRGCSQLSSYSTYDKKANYAVKLSLGFCIQPEVQRDGIQGCFFLKKL